jgi:bifunctional non-homologous end joining protein LigD
MTREGKVRHSVFHGLRDDKPAEAVSREEAVHVPPAAAPRVAKGRKVTKAAPAAAAPAPAALPAGLRVSNPERVIDVLSGTTKIALVRYYALVAPLMMEHLRRRPIAMVRAPDGVGRPAVLPEAPGPLQDGRRRSAGPEDLPGPPADAGDRAATGPAVGGADERVEFHTWNSVASASDTPDRMTFDLDPGEGVGWAEMQEAAQLVHAFLDELGLARLAQDQRRQGPARGGADQAEARVGPGEGLLAGGRATPGAHHPATLRRQGGPKNRVGRIFIDYLRNGFGATTACAWSARARPGHGHLGAGALGRTPEAQGRGPLDRRHRAPAARCRQCPLGGLRAQRRVARRRHEEAGLPARMTRRR